MATNIKEIGQFLFDAELRFKVNPDGSDAGLVTSMKNYRNVDGQDGLLVIIKLTEEGKYIEVFAPMAYKVPIEKMPLFAQACGMIQFRTKLIQFEIDDRDGEIRPIIEFPLEDSFLTQKQLLRCVYSLAQLVDEYDYVLRGVLEKGIINFDKSKESSDELEKLLESLPPEMLEEVLKKKRKND